MLSFVFAPLQLFAYLHEEGRRASGGGARSLYVLLSGRDRRGFQKALFLSLRGNEKAKSHLREEYFLVGLSSMT
jgi:hypothetical protein